MPLSAEKQQLLSRVQYAIQSSGWSLIFENTEHPCFIRAFHGVESIRMLVYIWRLTRGGPPGVRPAGEFRIQLTGVEPPLTRGEDFKTLLLGYHESLAVFASFDVERRPERWGASPSVQIREDALRDAASRGFGFYRRGTRDGEFAVAFTPDGFMTYAKWQAEFHEFGRFPEEATVLREAASQRALEEPERGVDLDRIGSSGRKEVIRAVKERIGQANFRARVLAAYRHHCAMCGLQLELVEASHIVPVHVNRDNSTRNGMCLCYLHHEAYDKALVAVDERYRVITNDLAFRRLRRINRNSRENEFLKFLQNRIVLPERQRDHPSPVLLREGLRIRGWPGIAA